MATAITVTGVSSGKVPAAYPKGYLAAAAALLVLLIWAYWPTLCEIADRWVNDPKYSHGYFVPVFALFLLWKRRDTLADAHPVPNPWGLVILIAGLGLHLAGARYFVELLCGGSLLLTLTGLVLGLGGWKALNWAWPSIAFLGFMLPLPYFIEIAVSHPLQRLGTEASAYVLQLIGVPAVPQGTTILLERTHLGVVDACSGLGMLVTFIALATAVAILLKERPWIDRVVLVLSAVPIAVIANIARITVTGLLYHTLEDQKWGDFSHDLAGWFLMTFALVLFWLEAMLMKCLFVEVPVQTSRTFNFGQPSMPAKEKQKLSNHRD
jgi:exosortase